MKLNGVERNLILEELLRGLQSPGFNKSFKSEGSLSGCR